MDTPQKQGELRPQLHKIVTRDGKSHRIPEILEAELDDLEALFSTLIKQWHQSELRKAEVAARVDTAQFASGLLSDCLAVKGARVESRVNSAIVVLENFITELEAALTHLNEQEGGDADS